jgi:hypothetical protein
MATTSPTGTPAPVQAGVMVSIDAHIQERIHAAIQELRAEFDERLRKLEEQRDTPAPPEKGAEPDDVQYIAGTRIPAEIASRGPTTVPTPPMEGIEGMSPNQIIAAHAAGMLDVTRGQHKTEDERKQEAAQAEADDERAEGEEAPQTQATDPQLTNEGVASVDVAKEENATGQVEPQQITPETAPGLDAQAEANRQQQE